MKKRFISIVLVLCLMLTVFPVTAFAEEDTVACGKCGDNLIWTLDTNTGLLNIEGTGMLKDQYTYSSYKSIIKTVVIEDGVTRIGDAAFADYENLTSVTIPNSVTSIGNGAFRFSRLSSVMIPDSVTWIGEYAFYRCENLTSVTIPDGLTSIGVGTFQWCRSLTSVTIPDSVIWISEYAFADCENLTSVTIPDGLTSIGVGTFQRCSSLTSVTIPNSVNSIGNYAFDYCSSLTSVTIGNNVSYIGDWAFSECRSLSRVDIGSIESWCNISFSNYGSNPLCQALSLYLNGDLVTDLVIPEGVTNIGEHVFYHCKSLNSIIIPGSVSTIGDGAFRYSNLSSIIFEGDAPQIGANAFEHITATAHYQVNNDTWTEDVRQNYGGKITWTANYICDHTLSKTEAKPATCTEDGNIEYWTCSKCGKVFSDAEGTTEISMDAITIAKGHAPSDWIVDKAATSSSDGTKHKECTVCHEVLETASIPPTGGGTPPETPINPPKPEEPNQPTDPTPDEPEEPDMVFTDVHESDYFYDAVVWAVENGITKGATDTTFDPNGICTRAQVVTFLWRSAGEPEPTATENPFLDVAVDQYYCKAVLWAVENGITKGTSSTTFGPNDTCTRAQVVTFLWRAKGEPDTSAENPFDDVGADTYYAKAVQWAVKNGVTKGTSDTTFSPADSCERGQVVTFLYRAKTAD